MIQVAWVSSHGQSLSDVSDLGLAPFNKGSLLVNNFLLSKYSADLSSLDSSIVAWRSYFVGMVSLQ